MQVQYQKAVRLCTKKRNSFCLKTLYFSKSRIRYRWEFGAAKNWCVSVKELNVTTVKSYFDSNKLKAFGKKTLIAEGKKISWEWISVHLSCRNGIFVILYWVHFADHTYLYAYKYTHVTLIACIFPVFHFFLSIHWKRKRRNWTKPPYVDLHLN